MMNTYARTLLFIQSLLGSINASLLWNDELRTDLDATFSLIFIRISAQLFKTFSNFYRDLIFVELMLSETWANGWRTDETWEGSLCRCRLNSCKFLLIVFATRIQLRWCQLLIFLIFNFLLSLFDLLFDGACHDANDGLKSSIARWICANAWCLPRLPRSFVWVRCSFT